MELKTYFVILWRRKWVIVVTAAVTLIVVVVGTFLMKPTYIASTTLRVAPIASPTDQLGWDQIQYADRLMNTYAKIITSDSSLQELTRRLGLDKPPKVAVEIPANTELMQITVEDQNPTRVKDAANALAEILIAQVRAQYTGSANTAEAILKKQLDQIGDELNQARRDYENLVAQSPDDTERIAAAKRLVDLKEGTYNNLMEQYDRTSVADALRANTISVLQPAVVPDTPSKPRKALNIALGLLVGLVGGLGLAFLFENFDTRLYTTKQIEEVSELSTIGEIPIASRQQLTTLFKGTVPQEEAFRRLRTNIFSLGQDVPLQSVIITSAEPGEGKSTVVTNLAFAVAKSGRKTIIVDADLRMPTIDKILDLPNTVGLTDILKEEIALNEALQATDMSNLRVITSGPLPDNPAELLGSPQMTTLVLKLVQQFDLVLLDTPALQPVTDAVVLSHTVDGVILVVGRGQARQEDVQAARQQLAKVKARLVGVVVNRAEQVGIYPYAR